MTDTGALTADDPLRKLLVDVPTPTISEQIMSAVNRANGMNARTRSELASDFMDIFYAAIAQASADARRDALGIDGAPITLTEQEQRVIALRRRFGTHWRERDDAYWFQRLAEELGELGASLAGDHKDPPELELRQIAAICINWLEMRAGQSRLG